MGRNFKIILGALLTISASVAFPQKVKTDDGLKRYQMQQNLTITKDDILIERSDGKARGTSPDGFYLYIRRKEGVNSVMLVETLKDPEGKRDNYAFRAKEFNEINGNEIRYLDGKKLESKYSRYSLISSTPTNHPNLGECFKIYIPHEMEWGYPWSRNGTTEIAEGTFINIRTFEKKYGDYNGQWKDNPFMFAYSDTLPEDGSGLKDNGKSVTEDEIDLSDRYSQDTSETFSDIAQSGNGIVLYSKGPEYLGEEINSTVGRFKDRLALDVVFAIDTTGSMNDDIETLKEKWVPELQKEMSNYKSIRLGLVCYRDYSDNYNHDGLPVMISGFTEDAETFGKSIKSISIKGNEGGDVPEAVYEALYAAMNYFEWRTPAKKCIVLIGDAEPHPTPKGSKKITKDFVYSMAKSMNIEIDSIIIPN